MVWFSSFYVLDDVFRFIIFFFFFWKFCLNVAVQQKFLCVILHKMLHTGMLFFFFFKLHRLVCIFDINRHTLYNNKHCFCCTNIRSCLLPQQHFATAANTYDDGENDDDDADDGYGDVNGDGDGDACAMPVNCDRVNVNNCQPISKL